MFESWTIEGSVIPPAGAKIVPSLQVLPPSFEVFIKNSTFLGISVFPVSPPYLISATATTVPWEVVVIAGILKPLLSVIVPCSNIVIDSFQPSPAITPVAKAQNNVSSVSFFINIISS